jgi:hypothetical protein
MLLIASQATAQKVVVDVTGMADGTYILTIDGAKVSLESVRVLKPGSIPVKPDPDSSRVEKFEKAADAVNDKETAKNLMALYQGMAQKSRPPNPLYTTPDQLTKNLKAANDIFLMGSAKKEQWQTFRDILNAEWTKVVQEGGGMEDYAKLLDDASAGLASSADAGNAAFDITAIFKILEILADESKKPFQKVILILPLIIALFA